MLLCYHRTRGVPPPSPAGVTGVLTGNSSVPASLSEVNRPVGRSQSRFRHTKKQSAMQVAVSKTFLEPACLYSSNEQEQAPLFPFRPPITCVLGEKGLICSGLTAGATMIEFRGGVTENPYPNEKAKTSKRWKNVVTARREKDFSKKKKSRSWSQDTTIACDTAPMPVDSDTHAPTAFGTCTCICQTDYCICLHLRAVDQLNQNPTFEPCKAPHVCKCIQRSLRRDLPCL